MLIILPKADGTASGHGKSHNECEDEADQNLGRAARATPREQVSEPDLASCSPETRQFWRAARQIWREFGGGLEQIRSLFGGDLGLIWRQEGARLRRSGGYPEAIWSTLEAIWRQFGGDLDEIWGRLGGRVARQISLPLPRKKKHVIMARISVLFVAHNCCIWS